MRNTVHIFPCTHTYTQSCHKVCIDEKESLRCSNILYILSFMVYFCLFFFSLNLWQICRPLFGQTSGADKKIQEIRCKAQKEKGKIAHLRRQFHLDNSVCIGSQ